MTVTTPICIHSNWNVSVIIKCPLGRKAIATLDRPPQPSLTIANDHEKGEFNDLGNDNVLSPMYDLVISAYVAFQMWNVPIGSCVSTHSSQVAACLGRLWNLLEADPHWKNWITLGMGSKVVLPAPTSCPSLLLNGYWSNASSISWSCDHPFLAMMDHILSSRISQNKTSPSAIPLSDILVIGMRKVINILHEYTNGFGVFYRKSLCHSFV